MSKIDCYKEYLLEFGLINMNGRMYDPLVGRFLSPDPYVQYPGYTQSYNRYSYCLNNPLKYTDPTGEFIIIDSWLVGFFKGLYTKGESAWKEANRMAGNDAKIWGGLFVSDPNKNFWGRTWEVISRLTWQAPQTVAGFLFSQVSNIGCQIDNVNYKYGATVLSGNFFGSGGAVTLGSYINGSRDLKADPNNPLFQHEYGHYLQSQEMGFAYLSRVGFPSLMSANGDGKHKYQPFEQDANRRAFKYFNKNVEGFYQTEAEYRANQRNGIEKGWDFWSNPLDVNHTATRDVYYDYYNSADMALVNSLALRAKWYDYLDPFGIIVGTLGNGLYYRNHRVK
jgi:RHS repeat-associated protein